MGAGRIGLPVPADAELNETLVSIAFSQLVYTENKELETIEFRFIVRNVLFWFSVWMYLLTCKLNV